MAKPPSDTPTSAYYNPDFGLCFGRRSSGVRKRTRDTELVNDIVVKHAKYTEDSYKTRRVNPDRLALRLDPELVTEMEALIIPGAKMPTFAVRKDFQERYSVDRRHIYDYFHSRGLRVAKEDKHNNLTRARSLNAIQPPIEPKIEQVTNGDSETSNRLGNPPVEPPQEPRVRSAKHVASARISPGNLCRRVTSRSHMVHKKTGCTDPAEALSPGKDDRQFQGDSPISPPPDFTLPEEFPDTPLLDEDTYDLVSDSPSEHLSDLPDLDLWHDYSIDLPLETGGPDPIMSIDEHRSLTKEERIAFYNLIDKNISPPNGVEECSGTYGAYMEEQTRSYYDRLFSKVSHGQSKLYHPTQEDDRPDTCGDFRKWLSNSASQDLVRAVPRFQCDKQPAVFTRLRNHHPQALGGLQYSTLRPHSLGLSTSVSGVLEQETNENYPDLRTVSSPSQRISFSSCRPMFRHPASQVKPALLVPVTFEDVAHCSSAKSTDNNRAKRDDASRCKLVPLKHGSPRSMPHHVSTHSRTVSAG